MLSTIAGCSPNSSKSMSQTSPRNGSGRDIGAGVAASWPNADGQLANAFKKGTYSSVNLLYMPVKNMTVGGELLWGKRENKDGQSGDDTRVQFSARYKF